MAPKRKLTAEKDKKCINETCEYHDKVGSMVKTGRSGKNAYFQCRRCKRGYSSTYGTIFRRKKTAPEEIIRVLKSLAEGNSIRGAGRIFDHDKNAIINWLKQAGEHCEKVERQLIDKFDFSQAQVDELWTFILKKTTHPLGANTTKQKHKT